MTRNPVLVGLVGEAAVAEYLTRRGFQQFVDLTLRPYGDGGRDIVAVGLTVQIKTRRKGIGKRSLIRRVDDRKHIVPLNCDVFVFAQWDETAPSQHPTLLGWQWADAVRKSGRLERSPIADAKHWNLRVLDMDLDPMNRLVDELSSRRCA